MNMPTFRIRSFELGNDQTVVLDALRMGELRIRSGKAWVTIEGDARDLFLQPGDRLPIGAGRVQVQGLGPTRVALVERPAGRLARVGRWLTQARLAASRQVRRLQFGGMADQPRG